MEQDGHVACFGESDIAFVIPHENLPSWPEKSERPSPFSLTRQRPRSLSIQSSARTNSMASNLGPLMLIEMGFTPDDIHPGLKKRIRPCSTEFSATK